MNRMTASDCSSGLHGLLRWGRYRTLLGFTMRGPLGALSVRDPRPGRDELPPIGPFECAEPTRRPRGRQSDEIREAKIRLDHDRWHEL